MQVLIKERHLILSRTNRCRKRVATIQQSKPIVHQAQFQC